MRKIFDGRIELKNIKTEVSSSYQCFNKCEITKQAAKLVPEELIKGF